MKVDYLTNPIALPTKIDSHCTPQLGKGQRCTQTLSTRKQKSRREITILSVEPVARSCRKERINYNGKLLSSETIIDY